MRLRPPSDPSAPVRRDALLRRIEERGAPVTLLCGPAGSGKSSLLVLHAASVAAAGAPVAWVSIDRYADDASALWTDILAALVATGCFPPPSRLHDLEAPRAELFAPFVDEVIAAIEARDHPLWLVLDDVHHVRDQAALRSLGMLVDRIPEGVHLVIASRQEPPLGLPRLRVEGRLFELRADDLAFSLPEAKELLRQADPGVTDTAIEALHERTEGWAAGLRLAAMAIETDPDSTDAIEHFSGGDAAVADYLMSEVAAGLPEETLHFLRTTSICRTVHVDLARQLSGRTDAADVLDGLERANIFTLLLSRDRQVYRYHELMRAYLITELRRTDPDGFIALHARAADWYAERGEVVTAMDHLTRTGDVDHLVEVVAEHGIGSVLDGQARAVSAVLGSLDASRRKHPMLALVAAAAELELEDVDSADRWLSGLDVTSIHDGSDQVLMSLGATIALARARYGTRFDDALGRLEASHAGETGVADLDLLALHHRGVARLSMGRYEEAATDLRRSAHLARATGRAVIEFASLSYLAGTAATTGALVEMRTIAEQALALAERRGWSGSQPVVHALLLLAWSAYLRCDRPEAVATSRRARALLGPHVDPDLELAVRSIEVLVAADDSLAYEALRDYLIHFERLIDSQISPALLAFVLPDLVRISLDTGERGWAGRFADVARARLPDTGECALIRSMMLLAAGQRRAAGEQLGRADHGAARCLVVTTEVHVQVSVAVFENRRGNTVRAREHLASARRIAAPIELVRPFVHRDDVRELLIGERGSFHRDEWLVDRVLAEATPDARSRDETERLTSTELSVLRDLPSLLSLHELADRRGVSVNTIKTHVRSIYRKLDVGSRRTAVDAARRQGLL